MRRRAGGSRRSALRSAPSCGRRDRVGALGFRSAHAMARAMRNMILVCIALGLVACGNDVRRVGDSGVGSRPRPDGGIVIGDSSTTASCSASDFSDDVVAFCRNQNPAAPGPRTMGAGCTGDTQCDSAVCLEPYGSSAYCTIGCPLGTECPLGFSCQDTGSSLGSACYQDVCIYGGRDAADCVSNTNGELDTACSSSCQSELRVWLTCLRDAGRICSGSHAAELCGIERGLLESCCPSCGVSTW